MLTTSDWIARAAAAPDECALMLAHAESAARSADDHVAIATAWLDANRVDPARRSIAIALAVANGEHWPTVRAAEVLLRLGDRNAAAAALGRIDAQLRDAGDDARSYRWILLAKAYLALLGDEASAVRAVKRGQAIAHTTADLADAARGLAEHVDRDAARPLLERAEARAHANDELRDLWGVAIVWQQTLEDEARARAVLASATAATPEVGVLTSFATAWRSLFNDDDQVRATLARAETLATTPAQWLDIAEAYFDGGRDDRTTAWDAGGVRRALAACIAAAPPPELQPAIAAGYRDWLGEPAAGLPTGVAPEDVVPVARALDGWDCSTPRALLDRLRERITPVQLDEIAHADYGHDWRKHQRALLDIHATGLVPLPLDWYPREVLELVRWSQGATTDHVARAFACAVLAYDWAAPTSRQNGHLNDVLAPLLESAWGLALDVELERTLVWLAEVVADEVRVWPLFALALTHARHDPDDARLTALVRDIVAAETDAHYADWGTTAWLFRTTNFDTYHPLWRELARIALTGATQPPLVELATLLAIH